MTGFGCSCLSKPCPRWPGPAQAPKSLPDFESCGAVYVAPEEVEALPLRSSEPRHWIPYVARGGLVSPLAVFTPEHAPVALPAPAAPGAP